MNVFCLLTRLNAVVSLFDVFQIVFTEKSISVSGFEYCKRFELCNLVSEPSVDSRIILSTSLTIGDNYTECQKSRCLP